MAELTRLTRKHYWATFFVVDCHRRGAIHEAENCAGFYGVHRDDRVRITQKKAQSLLDTGKVWLCKRCGGMK